MTKVYRFSMGRQEVATLKNLLAPPKRDKVWPAEKFDLRKHSKFPRLVHVLAFNSLSGKWGFHSLRSLREVPTYLVPERGMKRAERIRPFETYSFSMKKKVTLHFFARLEPGLFNELDPVLTCLQPEYDGRNGFAPCARLGKRPDGRALPPDGRPEDGPPLGVQVHLPVLPGLNVGEVSPLTWLAPLPYPKCAYFSYTYPHNRRVTNIYEKVAPRIKYLPDSEDEEEKTSNK